MERRTAISGLMPARPLRMPDNVLRLIPRDRAASVTVRFRGSRHSVLSTSPGCGGLCIFIMASVIVLLVNPVHVSPSTCERDTPVATHLNSPRTLSRAAKFVEIQAGQVHVLGAHRHVQAAGHQPESVGVFSLNSRLGASGEELFESFVPESCDRHR